MIQLVVADIDGCFSGGGRRPLNLDVCRRVAEWNALSATDPTVPHFVFNTGRPVAYVQAMAQAVASRLPSIAEFGAVLWHPVNYHHDVHPDYTDEDRRRYEELLEDAEREFGALDSGVMVEVGKLCQLTLYPRLPATIAEVAERAAPFAQRWKDHYVVDRTPAVLNFLPPSVNKGTALDWLAQVTGIPTDRMAGIGDSECDLRFLRRCALSGAPRNAAQIVREQVTWALGGGPEECILEFVERVIAWNHRTQQSRKNLFGSGGDT